MKNWIVLTCLISLAYPTVIGKYVPPPNVEIIPGNDETYRIVIKSPHMKKIEEIRADGTNLGEYWYYPLSNINYGNTIRYVINKNKGNFLDPFQDFGFIKNSDSNFPLTNIPASGNNQYLPAFQDFGFIKNVNSIFPLTNIPAFGNKKNLPVFNDYSVPPPPLPIPPFQQLPVAEIIIPPFGEDFYIQKPTVPQMFATNQNILNYLQAQHNQLTPGNMFLNPFPKPSFPSEALPGFPPAAGQNNKYAINIEWKIHSNPFYNPTNDKINIPPPSSNSEENETAPGFDANISANQINEEGESTLAPPSEIHSSQQNSQAPDTAQDAFTESGEYLGTTVTQNSLINEKVALRTTRDKVEDISVQDAAAEIVPVISVSNIDSINSGLTPVQVEDLSVGTLT